MGERRIHESLFAGMKPTPSVPIQPDPEPIKRRGWPVLFLGFRPFFLVAPLAAIGLVLGWVHVYRRGMVAYGYYDALTWHAHEMVFGFAAAVIAGFLLTAVVNWTKLPTWSGKPLIALVLVWLTGRVLPYTTPFCPRWLVAGTDLIFFPLLAAGILPAILRSRNRRNYIFPVLLALFTLANLLVHLQMLGLTRATARLGFLVGVDLVIFTILFVAGRIMPFFSSRGLPGFQPVKRAWIEWSSLIAFLLLAILDKIPVPGWIVAGIAFVALILHAIRVLGWYTNRIWRVPLLWVLYLGYLCLMLGMLFTGLAALNMASAYPYYHLYTAGGVGLYTLGFMTRVSRGHTGRPLLVDRPTTFSFLLMVLAVLLRVGAASIWPAHTRAWILASGVLWSAAFLLFLVQHTHMLVTRRPDGAD